MEKYTPDAFTPSHVSLKDWQRFCKKIIVSKSGCWLWQGYARASGYGSFSVKCKTWFAHRFSYTAFRGDIPDGLQIDHLCKVRNCVNPAHLEAVTQQENILRSDTITMIHKRQTHCKFGHEFVAENILIRLRQGRVHRECLVCRGKRARRKVLPQTPTPGAEETTEAREEV